VLPGWSYGGYMTAIAVTPTDRFRAASMGAWITNLNSLMNSHDIPDYMAAHIGSDPWEDYPTWEKHSAIYGVGNVTTPTQVIHGQDDRRVPLTQGLEFYNALRRRGVPTEMVIYPRTGHGPAEPKIIVDLNHRILEWFERHLGRSGEVAAGGS
jgi:dipeptidyl aminopeptidase/acylaminoacyl peptidase